MNSDDVPKTWPWLLGWFLWYVRGHVRKHFHGVRISREGPPPDLGERSAVVVMNHPSWWDPLFAALLTTRFPNHTPYAPIDGAMLRQYPSFGWLGFYGIEPGTLRGAAQFLRVTRAILEKPRTMAWVTVQGRFADVRDRPAGVQGGVGRLLAKLPGVTVLPLAVEYVFWNESKPEALARFGPAIAAPERATPDVWTARIEEALTATQDALAAEARSRDAGRFVPLLRGGGGVGGLYDAFRRLIFWGRGRHFRAEHEQERGQEPGESRE